MRRMTLFLLGMLLVLSTALAEPLALDQDLTSTYYAANADYSFTIALPQVAGDNEVVEVINNIFAMEMAEQVEFKAQIQGDFYEASGSSGYTNVSYEITCNNDDYFSVQLTTVQQENDRFTRIVAAHVFARNGAKAGQVISLPYLLGLLSETETDEWLQDYQTERADACIRRMVWEAMQEDTQTPYLDSLDFSLLEGCFYPEEDFWMEEDGALVFFIQEGFMAEQEAGLLTYRFTVDEILDEL